MEHTWKEKYNQDITKNQKISLAIHSKKKKVGFKTKGGLQITKNKDKNLIIMEVE